MCPKWNTLLEIVKTEIPEEIKKSGNKEHKIVILCSDNRTCHQLRSIFLNGPYQYLFRNALLKNINLKNLSNIYSNVKVASKPEEGPSSSKKQKTETEEVVEEAEEFLDSYILTMSQTVIEENDEADQESTQIQFEPFEEVKLLY